MKRAHHRKPDLLARSGRHAPLGSRVAGWVAPVVAGGLIVAAVAAGGILLRRSGEPSRSGARGTRPSTLVLLELRSKVGPLVAVVGSSGAPPPAVLTLPGSVQMTIPGQGDGSVKDAALLPPPAATTAISNLLGAWIPHYAVIDPAHLGAVVDRAGGIQLFGEATAGPEVAAALQEAGPARLLTWRETLIGLFETGARWSAEDFVETDDGGTAAGVLTRAEGAAVQPLPTATVAPGALRPDYELIPDLMARTFGASHQPPVRLIILNGTGTPGVGESVAERLIPNGFRIVASLNASTFDHEETLVVATSEAFGEAAERARALLGVGTVSASGVPSGLGDVTILVGEDYLNG